MTTYSLSHLSDHTLTSDLRRLVAEERPRTAVLLAHIAEFDARRLYVPAGFPSMFAYCVGELGLSEDAASRRIRVARLAIQHPGIFVAIAKGQLHLSAVIQLGIYLTAESGDDLLIAAFGKSKQQIEQLLARRFPQSESIPLVEASRGPVANSLPALAPVENLPPPARGRSGHSIPTGGVKEIAPQRFDIRITVGGSTRNKLRYAQELLGHAIPTGDLEAVLDRALDALIARLERRKLAATNRPRQPRSSRDPRQIPAHVRRAVWRRDGGRCTFVSEAGHACAERSALEFDHVEPVARGGKATLDNLRLRCRAHNHYEAERVYGADFMDRKREEARKRKAVDEVVPWLRGLGLRAEDARRAARRCESIPDAPIEERVRRALAGWGPRGMVRIAAPVTALEA